MRGITDVSAPHQAEEWQRRRKEVVLMTDHNTLTEAATRLCRQPDRTEPWHGAAGSLPLAGCAGRDRHPIPDALLCRPEAQAHAETGHAGRRLLG
jgi:hypothetical protein